MKKLLFLLILAAAAGGWYWKEGRPPQTPADRLTLYGNIDVRLVSLSFEVSGRIDQMAVSEGARIHKGEVLARLDPRRLAWVQDAARAKRATQREQVRALMAGTRPEEIRKLEAELAAARAQVTNAERSYQRVRDLKRKRLSSPQQSDDAKTAADAAAASVRSLQAALDLARAGPRKEDIAAAKATLSALEADLGLAEYNLQQATLLAPSDGVVQSRILEPGDMASPDRPVYTLALTEPLWARVYVPQPSLGKLRQGMPAYLTSDSFPNKIYRGWVGYIAPSAEFTPKSVQTEAVRADLVYQVRIFVCNPQEELRLGMPITALLPLGVKPLAEPQCGKDGDLKDAA